MPTTGIMVNSGDIFVRNEALLFILLVVVGYFTFYCQSEDYNDVLLLIVSLRAYPVEEYPCVSKAAAAVIHMIMNNLDPRVAQFPQELVTYGGNGQVFSNWAQVCGPVLLKKINNKK